LSLEILEQGISHVKVPVKVSLQLDGTTDVSNCSQPRLLPFEVSKFMYEYTT